MMQFFFTRARLIHILNEDELHKLLSIYILYQFRLD